NRGWCPGADRQHRRARRCGRQYPCRRTDHRVRCARSSTAHHHSYRDRARPCVWTVNRTECSLDSRPAHQRRERTGVRAMGVAAKRDNRAPAVRRATRIFEALTFERRASLAALARSADLAKSSASDLVGTLLAERLLSYSGDDLILGPGF